MTSISVVFRWLFLFRPFIFSHQLCFWKGIVEQFIPFIISIIPKRIMPLSGNVERWIPRACRILNSAFFYRNHNVFTTVWYSSNLIYSRTLSKLSLLECTQTMQFRPNVLRMSLKELITPSHWQCLRASFTRHTTSFLNLCIRFPWFLVSFPLFMYKLHLPPTFTTIPLQ